MLLLLYMFLCLRDVNAGSHSLLYFATYIIGQTPFPEFSVVVMLDDVEVMYYDSVSWRIANHSHDHSKLYGEEQNDGIVIFRDMYNNMKSQAYYLKNNLNLSEGVQVHQRLTGCELLENDKPGVVQSWDAFNGQIKEWGIFNPETNDIQMNLSIHALDHVKRLYMKFLYENIYLPICLKILRSTFHIKKNIILRKVKPRVRLLKKLLTASHEVEISCLATGFYPRHINLTLLRDGQAAVEGKATGGFLLPNGDGTYQMRKSLVISGTELHRKHNYSCAVNHLSLDNKLDIVFDLEEDDLGSSTLPVVAVICVVVFIVCVSLALIIWRKKSHAAGPDSRTSQHDYSSTPTQDTQTDQPTHGLNFPST